MKIALSKRSLNIYFQKSRMSRWYVETFMADGATAGDGERGWYEIKLVDGTRAFISSKIGEVLTP